MRELFGECHMREIHTLLSDGGKVLCLLAALAGCSPADDSDKASARPPNEYEAYCKAFQATGARYWLNHPNEVLTRPDEALKALSAAYRIKVDPEKLLASCRQGPYVVGDNSRQVGQLLKVARHVLRKEPEKARLALEEFKKVCDDAWPHCYDKRKE